MKINTFTCSICEQDLHTSELSDRTLLEANVLYRIGRRKDKEAAAVIRLDPDRLVCRLCDSVEEDGTRISAWNWGNLYASANGVYDSPGEFSPGAWAALAQSF